MAVRSMLLFAFIALWCPVIATSDRFQIWYPEYGYLFKKYLVENCSTEYDHYRGGKSNGTRFETIDKWDGAYNTSQIVQPVAGCIFKTSSEWMKANMASATVLLGLTPSILAALGPSVEEVSSLFVVAQRPLLGISLALGAPGLYAFRDIEYSKLVKLYGNPKPPVKEGHYPSYMVLIFESLLAGVAIVNNIMNTYQLGMWTSCVFAPHIWWLPFLWLFLGIVLHLSAAFALWIRVGLRMTNSKPPNWRDWLAWIKHQFTPTTEQEPLQIESREVGVKSEFRATISSWVVAIGGTVHLIFGTVTFSSLIFITIRDAVLVITRYMASLLICRIILMYEVRVLDDKYCPLLEETKHQHGLGSERSGLVQTHEAVYSDINGGFNGVYIHGEQTSNIELRQKTPEVGVQHLQYGDQ